MSKNPLARLRWAILVLLPVLSSHAQDFSVKRIESQQGKVTIYYDLADTLGRNYSIRVYHSGDNFLAAAEHVTGDAGIDIKAGKGKKIVWDTNKEFGEGFTGRVSLEVRGRVYVPFVRFEKFEEYQKVKRGVPYEISWTGGNTQNLLDFDLYKGDKKVLTITNVPNIGRHKITLPKNVKTGKNYRFRISDSKNKDDIVFTDNFTVKPKIPFILKVLPIAILGGVVYFLTNKKDEKIPDPVDPY
jgi:hypothetical protein